MAKQSLVWTALPNGYTHDGKSLRVSLLLSPRLDAESDPQVLASFPDFYSGSGDWPATLAKATFTVAFGSSTVTIAGDDLTSKNRIDDHLGRPDSKVWRALFSADTFVRGFGFKDLSANRVLSYPVARIDGLVREAYSHLAASAHDELPAPSDILRDPVWSGLVSAVAENDRLFQDKELGLRDPKRQFDAFREGQLGPGPSASGASTLRQDLGLLQLYHTPPSTPKIDSYPVPADDPKAQAKWRTYERTTLPKPDEFQDEIDFHQIVAAMNQYPTLLRRLGLVVDLLIAKDAFKPAKNAALRVQVQLPPSLGSATRIPDTSPRTRALLSTTQFLALPRPTPNPGDYRVVGGLLDLKDFTLLQEDADASGLKLMNFARSLAALETSQDNGLDPVTKQERKAGAPALRNAGLMLVHNNRGSALKNSLIRQKQYNTAAEQIQSGTAATIDLYAEDLVRGFRIDIWDSSTQKWRSLCQREAQYILKGGASLVITVPDEEGTVRLAATKSADPASNPDLIWLHEALVSWTGWSLCAPMPGRTIHHHSDPGNPAQDHVDEVGDAAAEIPPGLPLRTTFTALKGSLPRLRYGRRYWIRARAVDLASNSLQPRSHDFGPEKPKDNGQTYLRYEPIPPPAVALVKPTPTETEAPAEGESMECMAVRTYNDDPSQNTVPSTERARRFAVPARTTQREAEHHGMFDQHGQVDPGFFPMLVKKDGSLGEEKLAGARYAVMLEGDRLPYLPEPLALTVAARIFNLPGFASTQIIPVRLYPAGTSWPDADPFKVELYEDPADQPHFDEPSRTLFIPLPKAVRATLRLSIRPTKEELALLGVWDWLTDAQKAKLEQMALDGQHWMLTPWRNIELVHAVQKPLITPEITRLVVSRGFRATHARPNFLATCSIKSTDHLDLLARWNEPDEPLKDSTAHNRARTDHAFAIKITEPEAYGGTPDYRLQGTDLIRAGGVFHDLVTKKLHEFNDTRYRRIEYWLEATTKFREFMPAHLLTEMDGGELKPTDKNIKVIGPVARTWIPNSAPPPAPEVLYVVPTFGWVRSSDKSRKITWRRGGGLRIYLNRPWNVSGYGEMLGVVLPRAGFGGDPTTEPLAQPLKNFVTQWGNDPIWQSPFVAGAAPKRSNFPLARTAADPAGKWLPSFAPPEEADQPTGRFRTTTLPHPEIRSLVNPQMRVEVAPHDVSYDPERQLWYSDIEVTWGRAYYPFIRLALARYQPVSVNGAHLSNIVLADFMPLVPDRWLNVTQTKDPKSRLVGVFGFTYSDSSSHVEGRGHPVTGQAPLAVAQSSVVEVWVERLNPALGEDLGWQREADAVIKRQAIPIEKQVPLVDKTVLAKERAEARRLLRERDFTALIDKNLIDRLFAVPTLWAGVVMLPQVPGEGTRYRLAVAEYEEYLVDDATPYEPPPKKKDRRLVFVEYVEL